MPGKEQPEEQVKGQVVRMTRQQAEEKLKCLREFFPVVRLVDAGNRSKENQTETEYSEDETIHKTAQYVEVDGKPYILEILQILETEKAVCMYSTSRF